LIRLPHRQKPLRIIYSLGLSLTLVGGVAACSSGPVLTPTASSAPGDIAANFQALSDIPIPNGAKFDPEQSLVLGNLDRWTGRVVMNLSLTPTAAAGLFQQQMPGLGWQAIMAMQSDNTVLTYVRGERAATVMISPGGGVNGLLGRSKVTITVAPRPGEIAPQSTAPAGGYGAAYGGAGGTASGGGYGSGPAADSLPPPDTSARHR